MIKILIDMLRENPEVAYVMISVMAVYLYKIGRSMEKIQSEKDVLIVKFDNKMLEHEKNFITNAEYRRDMRELKQDVKDIKESVEEGMSRLTDRLIDLMKKGD